MEVSCGGNTIRTTPNPKYLGVTPDSSLTYTKYLSQLSMKVNALCNLVPRLVGTKWGAHFDVLQFLQTSTTTRASVPAEYCTPIDTNLHASSCQRDNASWHQQKQAMPCLIPPCWSRRPAHTTWHRDNKHTRTKVTTIPPPFLRTSQATNQWRPWEDQQGMGRRNLENKMGHHTLPIKGIHPYSITQTYRTRSNTTLASAPEPYENRLLQI